MKALGKLALTSALASLGAVLTVAMWATMLNMAGDVILLPITVGATILKFAFLFIVLPAAIMLVTLPLLAALIAVIVPLTLAFLAIGSVFALLVTLL